MAGQRITAILMAALGTGLVLLALVLGSRAMMDDRWAAERQALYVAYEWLPEPTVVPPTATAPATSTPTPTATPTRQPQPPTRLAIPKIKVNSAVRQVAVVVTGDSLNPTVSWPELKKGVGHDSDSANPGQAGNIILLGHNNTAGEVFRNLGKLSKGDIVHVYTRDTKFSYAVDSLDIVPAKVATDQDKQIHAFYLGPKSEETLTLVSCWPYSTYTHRIYVVAKPIGVSDQ